MIKKSFESGEYHQYSLIIMYCNDPKSHTLAKAKTIRKMYLNADIPASMQPKIVAVANNEQDAKLIQSDEQNGLDQVYNKVLPINEFG